MNARSPRNQPQGLRMVAGLQRVEGFSRGAAIANSFLSSGFPAKIPEWRKHRREFYSRLVSKDNSSLVVLADVFPHLVMPVWPFMPALRAPVIQMMRNAAIPEDRRHSVGRAAVLPRT